MRLIGLAGWSGAGKTTLLARLIPVLNARGIGVSTVKHAHHAFDVDKPGKDSHTHREAGARQVMVSSTNRWALMTELRGAPEPGLAELLARLDPVDLVIVEGFKRDSHPKIEVFRAANGKPWLHPDDPAIRAVAADTPPPHRAALCGAGRGGAGGGPHPDPCRAMAQLSDDCFAHGDRLLSVEEAAALVAARVPPVTGEEAVALATARGRVLARELLAPQPLPPFFNSAVDGYAFRHADLTPGAESTLRLEGRLAAGQAATAPIAPGTALRILTGAPMPPGADTVMMQEDTRLEGEFVHLAAGLPRGANCRPAGEDVALGARALSAGTRLGPAEIGLAAALGFATLPVIRRPRIGVFSTGDELASPGTPLGPAQTYDSNRFSLLALLAGLPVEAIDLGILPDDAGATRHALLEAAAAHDMLLTSGGVSLGEEDHVRAAIETSGKLVFWKLAVKPGRPAAMGVVHGTPVLGLPGNPVAAIVTFLHLARPMVLRLCGTAPAPLPRFPAIAAFSYRKKAGRREYVRVSLAYDDGPALKATKYPRDGAGLLTSLTGSDAFAELAEETVSVSPGDTVLVLPFTACF